MRRMVLGRMVLGLGLLASLSCRDNAPLPITLSITPLVTGLLPPGQPLPLLADIDFRHDEPMQSIRVFVDGVFVDTVTVEDRLWAGDLHREVVVPVPLADLAGPIHVSLGARVGAIQLRSDTVTLDVGDTERPRVHLAPTPDAVTPGQGFILGFSAGDNSGIVQAEAVFGGAWSSRIALAADGRDTLHQSFTVTVPPGPDPGERVTVDVIARDVHGNADTASAMFTLVDFSAPSVALDARNPRFSMRWVENAVIISNAFGAFLVGDTVRVRVRAADGVGLSYVTVTNRLTGTQDSMPLTGTSAEIPVTFATAGMASVRDWIVAAVHDRADNVRVDSLPVGVYDARIPPTEVLGVAASFSVFTSDGSHLVAGLGGVRVFAFDPFRELLPAPIQSGVWGVDVTAGGDSVVVAGQGGLLVGPIDGGAADYHFVPMAAGDEPLFVAALDTDLIAVSAFRGELDNVARLVVSRASGAATELNVGGADERVARSPDGTFALFGTGEAIGDTTRSAPFALPSGDISFTAAGDRILVGDRLYARDWSGTDLVPDVRAPVSALSPDGSRAWLAASDSPEVLVVRTADRVIEDRLLLPFLPLRFRLSPDGTRLVAEGGGSVALLDVR